MKNKKLMLVAVAAMGLVAAGTAGVGTAAWYQASNAVTALTNNASSGLSTVAYSGGLGSVRFNVAFSNEDDTENHKYTGIQLSYNDSGTAKTGYIANGVPYQVAAVDACFKVATVTITAELVDGVGGMTVEEALDSLYDGGTTTVNIYAKAAGLAVCNWDADGTLSPAEKNALVAKSDANKENTTIALVNGGATKSWTLKLALAVHTKNTNATEDTSGDHSSDGITVKSVEDIA